MKILPFGSNALLINFEQRIDPLINSQVLALQAAIESASPNGLSHYIPAYCSLTVVYDPGLQSFEKLKAQILSLLKDLPASPSSSNQRRLKIPVCYEEGFGLDLSAVSQQTGLSAKEIIHYHTRTPFQVYMLGFLPGFAYLGKLPEELACARKASPRLRVPARSVGLAGLQTGIYPSEGPGGWQIIGQTPVEVFHENQAVPFLFKAGDQVHFHAISAAAFHDIRRAVEARTFDNKQILEC